MKPRFKVLDNGEAVKMTREITIRCPACGATQRLALDTFRMRRASPIKSKRDIYKFLLWRQNRKCIVPRCPETRHLHLHRCLPGSKGGEYRADNCLLVCQRHHNFLEGCFTREEAIARAQNIDELELDEEQRCRNFDRQMEAEG